MSFELIVFDLDGTLVTHDFLLTEETLAAVAKIRSLGLRVSVATGRSYLSAKPFLDRLEIVEPMVFSNGSVFDNPETGERELIAGVPLESALIALMLADLFGLSVKAHFSDGRIVKTDTTPWPDEGTHFDPGNHNPRLKAELAEDPIKMVFFGPGPKLVAFKAKMESVLGAKARARLFQSHADYLEMVNQTVSKGAALLLLTAKMGIPKEAVITVGDQENDYEMLKYFGFGIQVGNGQPKLAEVAKLQIAKPDQGGIEEIYRYLAALP